MTITALYDAYYAAWTRCKMGVERKAAKGSLHSGACAGVEAVEEALNNPAMSYEVGATDVVVIAKSGCYSGVECNSNRSADGGFVAKLWVEVIRPVQVG